VVQVEVYCNADVVADKEEERCHRHHQSMEVVVEGGANVGYYKATMFKLGYEPTDPSGATVNITA
jgi:hypothetical protein